MPDDPDDNQPLQLDRAEYKDPAAAAPARDCILCHRQIADSYFEVNGKITCGACRVALDRALTGGSGAARFFRALAFGSGAAAIGAAIFFAVQAITGYQLGLIGLIVGAMVGMAVRKGANGRGGWGYQILAMLLTYLAIVTSYMPEIVKGFERAADKREAKRHAPAVTPAATPAATVEPTAATAPTATTETTSPTVEPREPRHHSLGVILWIFAFALACAAPFLLGTQNLMGLVIIGFSLWEAWKLNKRAALVINGPYRLSSAIAPTANG